MKNLFLIVLLVVLLLIVISIYLLRKTPFGLLDTKTAIALKIAAPPQYNLPVDVKRRQFKEVVSKFAKSESLSFEENRKIKFDSHSIPIRLYSTEVPNNLPILVYFHGGGWVVGDLDTHDYVCRQIAEAANVLVISVDYRRAPEYAFPIPLEDAYAAFEWIVKNAVSLGGNPQRVAIGGDSAGGNLSAALALKARNESGPEIQYQVLIYPVMDLSKLTTTSYKNFKDGFFLTKKSMEEYIQQYTPSEADRFSEYASPLLAKDLSNLPPAIIITAGFDPLRDEGEAYGKKLEQASVPVTVSRYKGSVHGFFGMAALGDAGTKAVDEVARKLKNVFY